MVLAGWPALSSLRAASPDTASADVGQARPDRAI
jgi:hypothetical protein